MLHGRRSSLPQMEKDFIFYEFVLNEGIMWGLEKTGNSDLLSQALKKTGREK